MATYTSADFPGKFTAADGYGIPREIVEALEDYCLLPDYIPWSYNNQQTEAVEILTDVHGSDDGSFAEGRCPTEFVWSEHKFPYDAKSFGRETPTVSYAAMVAKQATYRTDRVVYTKMGPYTIRDEWEFLMYITLRAVRRVYEWLLLNGSAATNPFNFDGLDRIIRAPAGGRLDINGVGVPAANSVVHSMGGAVTVTKLHEMLGALEANGVNIGDVTLLMRPSLFSIVASLISANYNDPGAIYQGLMQRKLLPLYGYDVPVMTSDCVGVSGTEPNLSSTIYFLSKTYKGMPSLEFHFFDFSSIVRNSDLFWQQKGIAPAQWVQIFADKGTYCTSTGFALFSHGKMVSYAPHSLGKLTDIEYTFQLEEHEFTQP